MMRHSILIFFLCFQIVIAATAIARDSPSSLGPAGQTALPDPFTELFAWPQTIHRDKQATSLSLAKLRLVGRMSQGIVANWVNKRNRGMWFECGIQYETPDEKRDAATRWAYHIVRSATANHVNPWGLAGTIANESNFDRCAIGYHPRKWAVRKQMLKPKRKSISYSAEEIISVYRSIAAKRRWHDTGWDAGPCQLLSKYYPGDIADMFSLTQGIDICAMEMSSRQQMYQTQRGWRWWRGRETAWYDSRVTHFARKIGANRGEI